MDSYCASAQPCAINCCKAELDGQQPVTALQTGEWSRLFAAWQQWLQALNTPLQFRAQGNGYRCWSPEAPSAPSAGEPLAFNLALAHYYGEGQRQHQFQRRSQQLKQQLQQLIARNSANCSASSSCCSAVTMRARKTS